MTQSERAEIAISQFLLTQRPTLIFWQIDSFLQAEFVLKQFSWLLVAAEGDGKLFSYSVLKTCFYILGLVKKSLCGTRFFDASKIFSPGRLQFLSPAAVATRYSQ
jgi:hypothetical protein